MLSPDLKYWLAISTFRKVGAVRFRQLYEQFPDMKTVWHDASAADLVDCGWPTNMASEFVHFRTTQDPQSLYEDMVRCGISVITINDPAYPPLLKKTFDPPALLYYQGDVNAFSYPSIAIVGTRSMSPYGRQMTMTLVAGLAQAGVAIVSGLALGIDTQAHCTALDQHTPTIAVLGSGLADNMLYPAVNRPLAYRIREQHGLLVSEFPPHVEPLRHHFPMRNRIIAGLSLGTVVIEAGEVSGALITAQYALDNARDVFAVPGNVSNGQSVGANKLLKDGAHLVTSVEDILEVLQVTTLPKQPSQPPANLSPEAASIYHCLSQNPVHIDALVKQCHLPIAVVNTTLMMMELQGQVKNIGNNSYIAV